MSCDENQEEVNDETKTQEDLKLEKVFQLRLNNAISEYLQTK